MQALLYSAHDTLSLVEQAPPVAGPGEVLLRVAACGICGSELESFRHRSPRRTPPLILGHEFCGFVEATGPGVDLKVGERVVSNSLVSCGRCVRCRRGDEHLCAHRQLFGMHRPGAFAEYVAVPAAALLAWPAGLPARVACLAEPLANGVHMVGLTKAIRPSLVLVIGAGPIGLLAQQAFQRMTHAKVVVSDLSESRLAVAARLGAEQVVPAGQADLVQAVKALTGGEGADVVIDAVGSTATKQISLRCVRPGGAVVWIGLAHDEVTVPSYAITIPEVQVHGTYGARRSDMEAAIGLLATGAVETESWVTVGPLAEGEHLFRQMLAATADSIKGVLVPSHPDHA